MQTLKYKLEVRLPSHSLTAHTAKNEARHVLYFGQEHLGDLSIITDFLVEYSGDQTLISF